MLRFFKQVFWLFLIGSTALNAEGLVWSVSPLLGIYSPHLGDLNKKEFKAPLPGTGGIIVDGEASVDYSFTIQNPLPEIRFASEAGIELTLEVDSRNSLLFGMGSWEGVSTSVIQTELPFQGELSQVIYERSGRISATQYYLGWRRNIIKTNKRKLYTRFTVNEFLDVDYKEDLVLGFQSGPASGFKRVIVMESQATGILLLQFGMGGEVFIRDWMALGFDVGYLYGIDRVTLGNARSQDDFQSGDSLDLKLPAQVGPDLRLWSLSSDGLSYEPMTLNFDGWRALLRVNFYF